MYGFDSRGLTAGRDSTNKNVLINISTCVFLKVEIKEKTSYLKEKYRFMRFFSDVD